MKKGIAYILLSGLSFMLVNLLVKILGTENDIGMDLGLQRYGAHELVLFRSLVSFSICAFYIKRKGLPFFGVNKKWLLVRGFSGVFALTIFFFTLQKLPIAIASIVQYLSPIFTVILAIFLLKEKIHKVQWLFILAAFGGVLTIGLNNLFYAHEIEISIPWIVAGTFSAFFSGLAYVAIVKLKKTDTPLNIVMYFPMLAIPIMVVWCIFDFVLPEGIEWFILLFIGLFTQFAQILMTKALHTDNTAVIVPFQYLGAIYAFLIGFYVFDEELSLVLYLALLVIVASVIGNTIFKYRLKETL